MSMESALPDYEILETLGQGSFGTVHRVRRKRDGHVFACKEINYGRMSSKEKELLVSEVNILRELNHPNIVRYVDRSLDRHSAQIYIIMEYCSGGDIAAYIKRYRLRNQRRAPGTARSAIREEVILTVASQILAALSYCHYRKEGAILHRDLKPGNIFLSAESAAKLGDFGLARTLSAGALATTNVGTPLYMSPEQTQGLPYDEKCDVWSLGCILYEMAALAPPFTARNQPDLYAKIRRGTYAPLPEHYSSALRRLVDQMLRLDPARRPSVAQLLESSALRPYTREQRDSARYSQLKRREAAVAAKERELAALSAELDRREAALAAHFSPTGGAALH